MSLLELFCEVDDFYQGFAAWAGPQQLTKGRKRGPKCRLSESEVMTILIRFHESHYRDFQSYDQKYVCKQLGGEFPGLVSYLYQTEKEVSQCDREAPRSEDVASQYFVH